MQDTGVQHKNRLTAPTLVTSVTVVTSPRPVPATQQQRTTSRRSWLVRFLLGAFFLWIGSYLLMEGLDLRFCQPLRMEHLRKVWHFQQEVPTVDVVYLGTSQVHYGVMPALVYQAAQERGIDLGRQFNLAVPGS